MHGRLCGIRLRPPSNGRAGLAAQERKRASRRSRRSGVLPRRSEGIPTPPRREAVPTGLARRVLSIIALRAGLRLSRSGQSAAPLGGLPAQGSAIPWTRLRLMEYASHWWVECDAIPPAIRARNRPTEARRPVSGFVRELDRRQDLGSRSSAGDGRGARRPPGGLPSTRGPRGTSTREGCARRSRWSFPTCGFFLLA